MSRGFGHRMFEDVMTRRTVIIGAGASVSYGLPLAGDLVTFAQEQLSTMLRRYSGSNRARIKSIRWAFLSVRRMSLLGLTQREHRHQIFVQNYQNEDKRLQRTLRKLNILPEQPDDAGADQLVLNGFFEQ